MRAARRVRLCRTVAGHHCASRVSGGVAAAYELGRKQGLREAGLRPEGLQTAETHDVDAVAREAFRLGREIERRCWDIPPVPETATNEQAPTDDPEIGIAQMSAYLAAHTGHGAGDFSDVDTNLTFRAYLRGIVDRDES